MPARWVALLLELSRRTVRRCCARPPGVAGDIACFSAAASVGVALVRMHTFQVGKHYFAVQDVPMITASVFDHGICDSLLVVASELRSATRTLLSELHEGRA
jgi:hypothetical protein